MSKKLVSSNKGSKDDFYRDLYVKQRNRNSFFGFSLIGLFCFLILVVVMYFLFDVLNITEYLIVVGIFGFVLLASIPFVVYQSVNRGNC